ncbi:MAG: hypothetical protein ACYC38_10940, partial [Eubacteriales bacterium]
SLADKNGDFLKIGDILQSGTFLKEVCPHTLDEVCPHTFKTPKAMKSPFLFLDNFKTEDIKQTIIIIFSGWLI